MVKQNPYIITAKLSGGSASVCNAHFTNGRTGETFHVRTNSDYEAICNLATDLPSAYANNDGIDITVSGLRRGGINHTVDTSNKGGVKLKITCVDVSTTNAPAVTIG